MPGSNAGSPTLTREADTFKFWGGAVARHGRSWCSTGFAVHWPKDGRDYLTTAAHCLGVGVKWYNGNVSQEMGVGTRGNAGFDLMFIRTSGAAPHIYTGPPAYTPGQGFMPVRTASHTHVGDHLCTSGASTGWHCYIRASGPTRDCRAWVATVGYLGNCINVEGGITMVAGQLVSGQGDSGGPVWTPINGFDRPDSAANARGLISSRPDGWPEINCGTDPVLGLPRICSTAVWFTDILSAIQPWVADGGMYVKRF